MSVNDLPIPRYYDLLCDAYVAELAEDVFDVRSCDDASMQKWRALIEAKAVAQRALIDHILANADDLKEHFK